MFQVGDKVQPTRPECGFPMGTIAKVVSVGSEYLGLEMPPGLWHAPVGYATPSNWTKIPNTPFEKSLYSYIQSELGVG